MSGTLDKFLPPHEVKSKPTSIGVEENCAKCGVKIPLTVAKRRLRIKGEEKPYCGDCYRKMLGREENKDEEKEKKEEKGDY